MRIINNILKLLTIYTTLLILYIWLTLQLRPDITPGEFFENYNLWILPAILLYIVINFKKLFLGVINKILILFIIFWSLNHFFPNITSSAKNYIYSFLPSINFFKQTANNLLTPKNGMQPKYQFETKPSENLTEKNSKPQNDSQKNINENKEKQNEKSTNNNIDIAKEIKEIPAKSLDFLPKEAKEHLENSGIDLSDPVNTLKNLQEKKHNLNDSFLK